MMALTRTQNLSAQKKMTTTAICTIKNQTFCFTCSSTSEKHFSVEKNSIRNCNFKRVQTSVSSNEIAVNTVNNTALNAVHKSVLGLQLTGPDINPTILDVQTDHEDTLPDLGRNTERDLEALLPPTSTTPINSNLQKKGQSTEDELDAVDACYVCNTCVTIV